MRLGPGFGLLRVTMAAITLLLLVKTAALVRVAAASVPTAASPARPAPTALAQSAAPSAAPLPSGRACPSAPSAAELALLGDLRSRKAGLDQRAAAIAVREQALAAAEKQLSSRLAELKTLRKQIETQVAARRKAASADTMRLVKVYEAMKPADAATIFNDLDRNVLLAVLDAMNTRRAAAILAAMKPQRARLVTAELATMRAKRDALLLPTAAQPAATGKPAAKPGTRG